MEAETARRVEHQVVEPDRELTVVRPVRDVPASRDGEGKLDAESRLQRTREDRRLLLRYHEQGDTAAREELVERFLPLARQLARRYQRTNEPLDDLMQVASVGLVKAIDRFDPARGTAFSTYAVPTILGELKRYFRDSGWAVHVPRGMQERVMKLDTTAQELHRKLGRSPSPKELATQLECSEEEVLEAMEAASAYDAVSLEQQRGDTDNGSSDTFQDTLGTDEERYELVEYGATIAPTLKALTPRERLILHLRFVEDMTQSEIADRIGVSQMHVSRLIRRSLARLRTVAEHDGTR
jgi:RNA polymerase sigma-B factor